MAHSPSLSAKMQLAYLNSNLIQWVWMYNIYINTNKLLTSLSKYLGVLGIRQAGPAYGIAMKYTVGKTKKQFS